MKYRAARLAATVVSLGAVMLLGGCTQSNKPALTGNVTVDGKTVRAGQVTFVGGPKNEKYLTTIGFDGRYSIQLDPGDYKVGVEGPAQSPAQKMGIKVTPPKMPKDAPVMKDPTGAHPGEGVDVNKEPPVNIPVKYRAPESSGLSVSVKAKAESFDIAMKSKG